MPGYIEEGAPGMKPGFVYLPLTSANLRRVRKWRSSLWHEFRIRLLTGTFADEIGEPLCFFVYVERLPEEVEGMILDDAPDAWKTDLISP